MTAHLPPAFTLSKSAASSPSAAALKLLEGRSPPTCCGRRASGGSGGQGGDLERGGTRTALLSSMTAVLLMKAEGDSANFREICGENRTCKGDEGVGERVSHCCCYVDDGNVLSGGVGTGSRFYCVWGGGGGRGLRTAAMSSRFCRK
jgi:hypothetical protein